ncbi:MAG: hypothetical protein JSR37_08150 [Verrucomicrobia bacterium]|nr:hypothetical protein [Verrucomicrobiota bacterium]MBS0637993.1 hypothetical protein [Verrucomicrobiota bacterium]
MKISSLLLLTFISLNIAIATPLQREYGFCSEELNSDYEFVYDHTVDDSDIDCMIRDTNSYCAKHCPSITFSNIDESLLSLIPPLEYECSYCSENSIYFGYIDPRFKRYSSHLMRQLKYSSQHPECTCYWPEHSEEARELSDQAVELFLTLIRTTALVLLEQNDEIMDEFRNTALSDCSLGDLNSFCVARQFRFSHYHRLTDDLLVLAEKYFDPEDSLEIKHDLQTVLKQLALYFAPLYDECLHLHPNQEIQAELDFTKLFLPDPTDEEWEIEIQEFLDKPHRPIYSGKSKDVRIPALNMRPAFHIEYYDLTEIEGQDEASIDLFKRLMPILYGHTRFYKDTKTKIPNFEDQYVEKLLTEINKRKQEDITIANLKELCTLKLENDTLSYAQYKMFAAKASYWQYTQKRYPDDYYPLTEFATMRYTSDYVASIWLAPDALLMAIFQDESVVRDLVKTRQEIFEAMERGDDRLVMQDTLRKQFSDKLVNIDPRFIDFRINRKQPHSLLLNK